MPERARRTAAEVRLQRQLKVAKRPRRRVPRQRFPRGIQRDYARALIRVVKLTEKALQPLLDELPQLLERASADRVDAQRQDVGEGRRVRELVKQIREGLDRALTDHELDALMDRLSRRVESFNRRELSKQLGAALGVNVFLDDKGLMAIVEGFAAENAALAKDLPAKIIGEIERMSTRAITNGTLHRDLAKQIRERLNIGKRRAKLIARDQVGKLYGQINATRQKNIGVTHFIWRTANDERVRDEHQALNGRRFTYSSPPSEGLPGEPIQCRCYAEPDVSNILGQVDT